MNYLDLTLIQFLDVLTKRRNEYICTITDDKELKYEIGPQSIEQHRSILSTLDLEPNLIKEIRTKMDSKPEFDFEIHLTEIEIYNYLEKVTSNFEKEKLNLLYMDIYGYYSTFICEKVNIESLDIFKAENWEIPSLEVTIFGETKTKYDFEKMRSKTHLFLYMGMEYCMSLIEKKRYENKQLDSKNKKLTISKEPLSFSGLFKYPYNQDLEVFKKKLQECNLTNDTNQWREVDNNGRKTPKKEIGMFFNWLYSETTVLSKQSDLTNECICFCKEFGIILYKDNEVKPLNGRIATAKLITNSVCDRVSSINYNTHFKTWINKER